MKLGETLGNVASFVAVVGAGVVAYKLYKGAEKLVAGGAKVGDAVIATVKKTVAEDLNPASDKNLVYSGINHVAQVATDDPNWNLGGRLWEFWNRDKVAKERALTAPVSAADASNVARQVEMMELAQDNFRRSEISAENDAARGVEEQMSRSKNAFRLSEIREQSGAWSRTDAEQFHSLLRTHG
jgi:hypothetical protein